MPNKTVLLVEDEFFVALLMEDVLQTAGFDVVSMTTGEDALAHLDTAPVPPDALVTDIRLPGMAGWDVARSVRDRYGKLPVVYVSGDSGGEWAAQGVSGSIFIQKPFSTDTLASTVESLVNSH